MVAVAYAIQERSRSCQSTGLVAARLFFVGEDSFKLSLIRGSENFPGKKPQTRNAEISNNKKKAVPTLRYQELCLHIVKVADRVFRRSLPLNRRGPNTGSNKQIGQLVAFVKRLPQTLILDVKAPFAGNDNILSNISLDKSNRCLDALLYLPRGIPRFQIRLAAQQNYAIVQHFGNCA